MVGVHKVLLMGSSLGNSFGEVTGTSYTSLYFESYMWG